MSSMPRELICAMISLKGEVIMMKPMKDTHRRKKEKKIYRTDLWKPFRRQSYRYAWYRKSILGIVREFGRDWFLGIMPVMLEEFKDNLHGYPSFEDDENPYIGHALIGDDFDEASEEGLTRWKEILDQMIFLLREADEDTCSKENPYEEQYNQASDEFEMKYGRFGEKLLTEEELEEERKTGNKRWYFPDDVEEYKPISDLYFGERRRLAQYREQSKNEALALFSKWFYSLWD